ncbi:MAG TPA: hypothetical protein VGA43_05725, partial [Deferrimonas sp.]
EKGENNSATARGVDDFGIDSGTEGVIAAPHSADRLRHLGDGGLLEKVTEASGLQYLVEINFPAVRRKDDNGGLRQGAMKEGAASPAISRSS